MSRRSDPHRLDHHPLFEGERRRARRLYARHAERAVLPPGAVLVEEGKQPVQVTWIRSGQAEVSRWGAPIGEVGPGAAVGAPELARLTPSDVTVTAVTPVDAVVLHRRAFRGAWRALAGVRRRVDQLTTH